MNDSLDTFLTTGDAWMDHMRRGEFEQAWKISDDVLRRRAGQPCWDWPRHLQYVWAGESILGKRLFIRCYHGLGDTLQYIRYARLAKSVASRVSVWVQPVLIPLLRNVDGIDELLPLHDGTPGVDFDVDVELMELPHVFRTTWETLPRDVPYIRVPPRSDWMETTPRMTLEVGVVWQSGEWDSRRSLPLSLVTPWARVPGLRLHSLQRGPAQAEWPQAVGIDSGSDDPLETAKTMRALDLVISVDSMPVHLAGALGVPVWTLLHHDPDWRWMLGRTDSPWYPTMRLFRQPALGDWDSVSARVGFELAKWARSRARS